jgi:hypothetical protein
VVAQHADPHAEAWQRVEAAIFASPGALTPEARHAVARGDDPPELARLTAKVRRAPYTIVDGDLENIDVDVVVEATLAVAFAEADARRAAALRAIDA